MLTETFKAGNKVFRTNKETLEVLKSVYSPNGDNQAFKFVIIVGLRTGDVEEIEA